MSLRFFTALQTPYALTLELYGARQEGRLRPGTR